MSALSIQPTYPIFTDADGQPLEDGYIWIGTANLDPQGNPTNVYWDAALTQLAGQPIRTLNGYPANSGTPARLYVNSDYSIRVMNRNGSTVYSAPTATERYSDVVVNITLSDLIFTQAGIGAVPRTALSKMREIVSVMDFGAVGDWDGVSGNDDTAAIQAAFDYAAGLSEAGTSAEVIFPYSSGVYGVSASINVSAENIYVSGQGIARIQPTDLSAASTYAIFNLTGSASRVTIKDLTFYMFGSLCNGIAANQIWRQATIENCQFIGGNTGLDFAVSGLDKWGTTINKCRFQDCDYGMRWIMNGQTGTIKDCLFFNCATYALVATNGWQLNVEGSVFESNGSLRGKAVYLSSINGAHFDCCQGELLFYDNAATGVAADYAYLFVNSNVKATACRWWGGSWGSVAPGNSRQYGVFLDNSLLTLESTELYGFQNWAVYAAGANPSKVFCDLASRTDYKIGGSLLINNTVDLGDNYVVDGAFERFRAAGTGTLPFSWQLPGGGGPVRKTTGLMGQYSVAALEIVDGNLYQTNDILVESNERIAIRFWLKINTGPGIKCAIINSDGGAILDYVMAGGGDEINIGGGAEKQGLIAWTYTIPATNVKRIKLQFTLSGANPSAQIEEVAVYKVPSFATTGAVYSDNDASFGFKGSFAPMLGYRSGKNRVNTAAPLVDLWTVGDRIKQRTPTVGQPKAWVCTVAGTPGTWVSEGNL